MIKEKLIKTSDNIIYGKGFVNDKERYHNESGIAKTLYHNYENKIISQECYMINNYCHRVNGPARICYFEDGSIQLLEYYVNGLLHKEDGSAQIAYNRDGKIFKERYFYNGIRFYSLEELQSYVKHSCLL